MQALKAKLASLGPAHSETSNTLWHLAEARWAAGRRQEAVGTAEQALGGSAALGRRWLYPHPSAGAG